MSDQPNGHPGLGEGTDITAADVPDETSAPPATSDSGEMHDDGLGTGDGADPQPGGAG